jgi:hypothetical protein
MPDRWAQGVCPCLSGPLSLSLSLIQDMQDFHLSSPTLSCQDSSGQQSKSQGGRDCSAGRKLIHITNYRWLSLSRIEFHADKTFFSDLCILMDTLLFSVHTRTAYPPLHPCSLGIAFHFAPLHPVHPHGSDNLRARFPQISLEARCIRVTEAQVTQIFTPTPPNQGHRGSTPGRAFSGIKEVQQPPCATRAAQEESSATLSEASHPPAGQTLRAPIPILQVHERGSQGTEDGKGAVQAHPPPCGIRRRSGAEKGPTRAAAAGPPGTARTAAAAATGAQSRRAARRRPAAARPAPAAAAGRAGRRSASAPPAAAATGRAAPRRIPRWTRPAAGCRLRPPAPTIRFSRGGGEPSPSPKRAAVAARGEAPE